MFYYLPDHAPSSTGGRQIATQVRAYFDGLCETRNPGGYACGGWHVEPHPLLLDLPNGVSDGRFYCHGDGATNNMAEYNAAIDALRAVYHTGYRGPVVLHGDSQLVVNQFNGKWKCHKLELQELLAHLHRATSFFDSVDVVWVPREENAIADELSRLAYEKETGKKLPR
jgi:ribonuclease HI